VIANRRFVDNSRERALGAILRGHFFPECAVQVAKDAVVAFHYTLTDETGATIDSSREAEPLAILHGHGALIAGVEAALVGRAVGERFQVTVSPEEGYGVRDESRTQRVPKKYFQDGDRLKAGMVTVLRTQQGAHQVTVVKVGATVIDIDGNHPLAGKTLNFDIEITDVREASAEELAHGHVHGAGGHHH
jgi:FKBP-type peptidyl-prolyl cis-trans isomerase SlyD